MYRVTKIKFAKTKDPASDYSRFLIPFPVSFYLAQCAQIMEEFLDFRIGEGFGE